MHIYIVSEMVEYHRPTKKYTVLELALGCSLVFLFYFFTKVSGFYVTRPNPSYYSPPAIR